MKHPILFFCLFALLFSCKKEELPKVPSSASHVFFKSQTDMVQQIRSVISQRHPDESLHEITHVSYIDSRDKSYALVFYKSNKRSGNLLLEQKYKKGVLVAASSGSCEGVGCDCKVLTTISNAGDVTITCSCSSCTLLTNQSVAPAAN